MTNVVKGQGGGKSGGNPIETENNLFSDTRAALAYAYSYGPVVPLGTFPDGRIQPADRSIYFDRTALANANGTRNFEGVLIDHRAGHPNQEPLGIPAIDRLETGQAQRLDLTFDNPYIFTLNDPEVQAVEVTLTFLGGLVLAKENGDIVSTSIEISIDVANQGGSFVQKAQHKIIGKSDAVFSRHFRQVLEEGTGPWQIRVRRLTPDSGSARLRNACQITQVDQITFAALSYPNTALIGLSFQASEFGGATRVGVEAYGRLIQVPYGYDPIDRTYPAIWDGTFSYAWTDNPVWVAFDLLTNPDIGLGLPLEKIDLAGFYDIAKYCDELVADGQGGFEPRYTFNGQIREAGAPVETLQKISAIWRGAIFSTGQVITATCDKPGDPALIVNASNVINGQFVWSTASRDQRASVFKVRWIDPARGYEEAVEAQVDADLLKEIGYREQSIDLPWCTSQGQAARMARWMRYTQRYETEIVTYQAGLDHMAAGQGAVIPGQLIALRDPARVGSDGTHGRILTAGATHVTLDRSVSLDGAYSYALQVSDVEGLVHNVPVTQASPTGLIGDFSFDLSPQAPWLLTWSDLAPELARVLSIEWIDKNLATVTALRHNPTKYAAIENDLKLEAPRTSLMPRGPIEPVSDLSLTGRLYTAPSGPEASVTLSWPASPDPRVSAYDVWVTRPQELLADFYPNIEGHDLTLKNQRDGIYQVRIRAKSALNERSVAFEKTADLQIFSVPPAAVSGFDADISQGQIQLTWDPNVDVDMDRYEIRYSPLTQGAIWAAASNFATVSKQVVAKTAPARSGTYLIKAIDTSGVYSLEDRQILIPSSTFETYNVVRQFQAAPAWAGNFQSTSARIPVLPGDDGLPKLQLEGADTLADWTSLSALPLISGYFPSEGTYDLALEGQGYFDLGGVYKTFVSAVADLVDYIPTYPLSAWGLLAVMGTLNGHQRAGLTRVGFEVQTTLDDPGDATATWTLWQTLRPSAYEARGFRLRARLSSSSSAVTPLVSQISVGFDMEDRVLALQDVQVPVGGRYVALDPPFKGDQIHVTQGPQNLPSGAAISISQKSRSGFHIATSGTGTPLSIDLLVRGYGAEI